VLRSGGPNHSKSLCVLVFFPFSRLTSKTARPLLILGFRAGALRHPSGDLLSDNHTILKIIAKISITLLHHDARDIHIVINLNINQSVERNIVR
jgi:hypothetical protein